MTQTPEQALATAHPAAVDDMESLRDMARRLQDLHATVSRAAQLRDADQLILAADHLLQLHAEFTRIYRAWLARRTIGQPPFIPLGGPDSMSV